MTSNNPLVAAALSAAILTVAASWPAPEPLRASRMVVRAPAFSAVPDAREPAARPKEGCPDARKVFLFGDSYGEGIGPHFSHRMKSCGVEYVWDARRGTSAVQWAQDEWLDPVLEEGADVVMVSLGGNDFQRGDADVVAASIRTITSRIRASGARLLWIEPLSLPYSDKVGVRAMWRKAAGADWFRSKHLEYGRAKDRVHTTWDNYGDWAGRIWPWFVARTLSPP